MQTTTLQPMPPFVTDQFVIKVLLALGGRATLPDMKEHIKSNYSGWTDKELSYFSTQIRSLQRSGYMENAKINYRRGESKPIFYITDEARAIIERKMLS
jgi:hypothetical protein